jgi:hypothetical protein
MEQKFEAERQEKLLEMKRNAENEKKRLEKELTEQHAKEVAKLKADLEQSIKQKEVSNSFFFFLLSSLSSFLFCLFQFCHMRLRRPKWLAKRSVK